MYEYMRRRKAGLAPPFIAPDETMLRPAESLYTRPRTVTPPVLPMPAFDLEASPVMRPEAPVTYTRPRMVDEPADELTKIAETRDYHANQNVTNDDPWWKNLLSGGVMGLASGPSRSPVEAVGRFLGGAGLNLAMPGMDDRFENQGEVAKLDDRYGQEYARQRGEVGLDALRADVAYKRKRPEIEDARLGALERRLDLTEVYNRGRLEESAANREVKVSEGAKNRTARFDIAEKNLKFRQDKDLADRELRRSQHSDRMRVAQANLAERVKARVSQEAARALAAGQRAKAIKITEAKARIWAKNEGANWDDFVDALDDNGIEITEK